MRSIRLLVISALALGLVACGGGGSDASSGGGLVGKWELSDAGSGRVPGFLKGHGYVFADDGTWRTLNKQNNGVAEVYMGGTYTLDGNRLTMAGENISGSTDIVVSGDELVMERDVSIRGGDDRPARTTYSRL